MRGFPSHCVAEVPSVEACGVPVKERVRGQGGQGDKGDKGDRGIRGGHFRAGVPKPLRCGGSLR
ncbi:MAG: hypothetical protein KME31_18825 [Tolypothrix carrinoi HA7290-LM1]|nr:hypothetical protein [Tolypothrix carrinoi HA7290-LM1]